MQLAVFAREFDDVVQLDRVVSTVNCPMDRKFFEAAGLEAAPLRSSSPLGRTIRKRQRG